MRIKENKIVALAKSRQFDQVVNEKKILALEVSNGKVKIQNQEQRLKSLWLAIGLLMTAMLCGILYYFFRKQKTEKQQAQSNYEIEVKRTKQLQATVHHLESYKEEDVRLKNEVFHEYVKRTLNITQEQLEAYLLVIAGKTNQQIATTLFISREAVKKRLGIVYETLKMYSNTTQNAKMSRTQSIVLFQQLYLDFIVIS